MTHAIAQNPGDVAKDFKLAMRRLAATVTLITTSDAQGRRHGMAATAVNSVTMDPPTLLVCINQSASIHEPLLARHRFCVNVLMDGHDDLVAAFSGGKTGEDRFAGGSWDTDAATDLPFLDGAQSNLMCEVASVTPVGTHSLVLARVVGVRVADSVAPLLYADGRLAGLRAKTA